MPENETALAGAPGTVDIGGTVFLLDKLTTATVFALYEWGSEQARKLYNPYREVCEALDGLAVDPADKTRLLVQAQSVQASGEIPGDLITKCLRSREGVAFYLWVLTRRYHPTLTYAAAVELVTPENRLDLYCQLDAASGANVVNKAVMSAGFFPPASREENHG